MKKAKRKEPNYEGLHLWEVEPYIIDLNRWFVTVRRNPKDAITKAQKWLRKNGHKNVSIKSVKDRGTIDA